MCRSTPNATCCVFGVAATVVAWLTQRGALPASRCRDGADAVAGPARTAVARTAAPARSTRRLPWNPVLKSYPLEWWRRSRNERQNGRSIPCESVTRQVAGSPWNPAGAVYDDGVVPEAPMEKREGGLKPSGEGWFVVNAREAEWVHN